MDEKFLDLLVLLSLNYHSFLKRGRSSTSCDVMFEQYLPYTN